MGFFYQKQQQQQLMYWNLRDRKCSELRIICIGIWMVVKIYEFAGVGNFES